MQLCLCHSCWSREHRCSPLAQSGQALSDQQAALGCGLAPQTAQCAGTPRCTQTTAAHMAHVMQMLTGFQAAVTLEHKLLHVLVAAADQRKVVPRTCCLQPMVLVSRIQLNYTHVTCVHLQNWTNASRELVLGGSLNYVATDAAEM